MTVFSVFGELVAELGGLLFEVVGFALKGGGGSVEASGARCPGRMLRKADVAFGGAGQIPAGTTGGRQAAAAAVTV
ncbi:hypothetical protein PV682_39540 [Streptomyces niveiscabiei]|uniref:hypothetical protein n=1 Tax=Streptomyces niveiscabiei TaxID=164115 RepID=UPI0029BAE309|nr:hypothetical protein [Streptomyces niveiscabiei]MDX3387494.1 hypothetical protein [Streptomyces niveiscabiei]